MSLEPSLGEFNPTAVAAIDYAVARARQLGIRLVVPLTDNWAYYHGGSHDFTDRFGRPAADFCTDERVIGAFEQYLRYPLTHVNPYTGMVQLAFAAGGGTYYLDSIAAYPA